jgi:hypothetical protein
LRAQVRGLRTGCRRRCAQACRSAFGAERSAAGAFPFARKAWRLACRGSCLARRDWSLARMGSGLRSGAAVGASAWGGAWSGNPDPTMRSFPTPVRAVGRSRHGPVRGGLSAPAKRAGSSHQRSDKDKGVHT